MNPQDPQEGLTLLDQLKELGFDDSHFWRLHQNRDQKYPRKETIESFRRYCERTGEFQADKNNARVTQRLALVLQRYLTARSGSRSAKDFEKLAEAAYAEIPPV